MCSPATCARCGKATYTGCGRHVDQVLANVPAARRCSCDQGRPAGAGKPSPSAVRTPQRRGWFAR